MAPTNKLSEIELATEPPMVVYKTRKDYSDLVPVIMDEERTQIVSYPDPSDLFYEGKLAKPTALKDGYLIDNRGINANVAFLGYTYEVYSKLKQPPRMQELLSKIVDKYPLLELVYCGSRTKYKQEIPELDALIDAGFPNCRKVEIISMQVTF